ncbi:MULTISPECIES: thioredoxin domain-containing protein [Pseudomonas]|jgi:thioredoxin 1|uniref:thioredoxin domain-containing protein n=1 Tax=Pseudomonas TaxID=286 RepID=UPI0015A2B018|nr:MULTISPECIES: thioredoxin domain-containing protein [Pseudomonas]NVZ83219.1 thioredoxin [Pseudomonas yamanorum]
MNYVNAVIEDKAAFERALDTPLPVFVVFTSRGCTACEDALPTFAGIASRYQEQVKVLILDCTNTPRHPSVTRVPMLLVYQHNVLLETLPGLAEKTVEACFGRYTQPASVTGHPASGEQCRTPESRRPSHR